MNQIEDFKSFVRTLPKAYDYVHQGAYTWQELYEVYVLYGKDNRLWNQFKENEKQASTPNSFDLSTLFSLLKNMDIEALMSSLQGLERVLGIAATLFDKGEAESPGFQSVSRMDD